MDITKILDVSKETNSNLKCNYENFTISKVKKKVYKILHLSSKLLKIME